MGQVLVGLGMTKAHFANIAWLPSSQGLGFHAKEFLVELRNLVVLLFLKLQFRERESRASFGTPPQRFGGAIKGKDIVAKFSICAPLL